MNKKPEDTKIIKIEEILGDFGFTLRWQLLPYWADVTAFEKISQDCETGDSFYLRKGAKDSGDIVCHIDEAEPYLDGYVKWDGCTELDQGRQHWCGIEGYRKHCDLLQYIYVRSQQLIDRANGELFGGEWK